MVELKGAKRPRSRKEMDDLMGKTKIKKTVRRKADQDYSAGQLRAIKAAERAVKSRETTIESLKGELKTEKVDLKNAQQTLRNVITDDQMKLPGT